MDTKDFEKWIWYYYDQGFSIIPLKEKDKIPNISKWKQYQETRASKKEIKEWLKKDLFQNIGVICGKVSNNLVVIDIDEKLIAKDLNLNFEQIFLDGGLSVETGKGYHIYIKNNGDPGELTKNDELHIEYRANGGYVVAPPSIHPSGKQYNFHFYEVSRELKEKDAKKIFNNMVLALEKKKGIKTKGKKKASDLKTGVKYGARNDSAFKIACDYRNKGLSIEDTTKLMMDWNRKCRPPLHEGELITTIKSAYKRNREQGKQGKQKQQQEKQQIRKIHGAGGIYQNLVIEPLGDYRYLYNYKGRKGITSVNFDPETHVPTIDITGEKFYFSSDPLKKVIFKIPSEESIQKYIVDQYQIKTTDELYGGLVNYFRILYDLPGEFYYHIIAIGNLQSWIIDILNAVFYLCFSAKFGAGKTAFLEGLSIVAHHGFLAGNISSSSVARTTNKYGLSLFADELDIKSKSKDNETYLTFRQGYKRNNPYVRQKETRRGYTEEIIDVFGFKGYSVHSRSEDALATRGIDIPLRISSDKTLPILNMYKDQIGFTLFEDLFFWHIENATMLTNSTKETKATWKKSGQQDPTGENSTLVALLPSFPGFSTKNNCKYEIKEIREELFKEFTKDFSEEEIETLRKFMGRNEELLYVALSVCKVFHISKLVELEHTFKQKVQNEGDDNIFVNLLKEYLKELYQDNYNDKDLILSGGDFDQCFYYEKSKIYRGFRKKLKDEDFYPIASDKFDEYLMDLNFNKGVNVKKERFKVSDDKSRTKLALIFDEEVQDVLELEKSKDLDDYDIVKESASKFKKKYGKSLDQDFFNEYYQMNFGEDEDRLYKDLVIMGLLDFVDENELRDFIKKSIKQGGNE